jgi:hypothetical protein
MLNGKNIKRNIIVRIKYLKSFETLFQSEFWPLSFGEGVG